MVQNRVALATPQLPNSVQQQGLTIKKKSPNILMMVNFFSSDGRYDNLYLSNYATVFVKDELFRLEGVGDLAVLGQRDYSIRVWLDPQRLAARGIGANDVVTALQNQNLAAAPGQIGQQPALAGGAFQLPIDTLGRLTEPEEFGNTIIKASQGGPSGPATAVVRLRDVARVELGAQRYDQSSTVNGKPSVAIAVYQLPGTNALDVARQVCQKMADLKSRFPDGLDYGIYYDTTPFIRESVKDVVITLLEAVALVALVVLVFLQNWRASLIPLVAVPVAIVGTFSIMAVFGFSLNNISLFGLVLAIGIVVDDAIVVVENVERWLQQGLPPKEAARRAMDEVTGPVIAVAVVLCAVFLPCAFLTGIIGQFFRQFAVTIAVSTVFSALNSLTLSPALAAILLKPHTAKPDLLTRLINFAFGWFFRTFNWGFRASTSAYARLVGLSLRGSLIVLLLYGGLLFLTWQMFGRVPAGFVPQQDQGWLMVNVQLPDSASVQRTAEVLSDIGRIVRSTPGVAHVTSVAGMSLLLTTNSSNFGSMFVILDPFDQRRSRELTADAIIAHLRQEFAAKITDAQVGVFGAPPVPGIGLASGFKLMVEDRAALGPAWLQQQTDTLIQKGREAPGLVGVFSLFRSNTPQLYMDIHRTKAATLGVSLNDLTNTLQTCLGSVYVNNFNTLGRSWQVNVQAQGQFRDRVAGANLIQVRNARQEMVPLGTLARIREISGPVMVTRYNLYPAAPVNGSTRPGVSSGQAIETVNSLARENLSRATKTEWTELTFMQIKAGNTAMYVFALAVVLVFLALAALYESWTLPLAVILVVPMCLLSLLLGVALRGLAMDVFVQIGFVVLVGLACKNAILIVEFAKTQRAAGMTRFQATTEACALRLRPILMTSFAFILGVVPMVVARGAGAEMRWSLGTAVFSGMLGVTLFGVFFTPVFFYVIEGLGGWPPFRALRVRRLGSLLFGAGTGLIAGCLAWKLHSGHFRLALLGGFALGLLTAFAVQRVRRPLPPAARREPAVEVPPGPDDIQEALP